MINNRFLCGVTLLLTLVAPVTAGRDDGKNVQILQTPSGIKFGLLGEKAKAPAPTLFVFATTYGEVLRSDSYNKIGRLLAKHGFLCVSLDLPCHGEDQKTGEPAGLSGWRARLEKDDRVVPVF